MSDPFSDAHRGKSMKDILDANAKTRQEMIERATAKGQKASRPTTFDKPYPWPEPFWK
jgi:hypothetical protein